jgi:hypothetical protein
MSVLYQELLAVFSIVNFVLACSFDLVCHFKFIFMVLSSFTKPLTRYSSLTVASQL